MASNLQSEEPYDFLFKVIVIGPSSVGKSNIMSRITQDQFKEKSKPTIGVEFAAKVVKVDGQLVKVQIWDTAGMERYRGLTSAYYRGAHGVMLVYDITSQQSFEEMERWLSEARMNADKDTKVMLIGNKDDLEQQRQVTPKQGNTFAELEGIPFFETSAKTKHNIEQAFNSLVKEICEHYPQSHMATQSSTDQYSRPVGPNQRIDIKAPKKQSCCGS